MPNEYTYSGSITGMTASRDDDGDGFTNIREKEGGTISTDNRSHLTITDFAMTLSTGIIVRWTSELDHT